MSKVNVAYLIGRFQVPFLSDGYKKILDDFLKNDFAIHGIILGIASAKASINNPLDFDSRRRMIEESYPNKFVFGYIKDERDDFEWSKKLDETIDFLNNKTISNKNIGNIYILGSKNNFIAKYFGKYEAKEIEIDKIDSVEYQKELVSKKVNDTASWRAGACWSASNRYPVAYHTVDCAIFTDTTFEKVWMARKENESKLRFVGGFVDPKDLSSEYAAQREAFEETSMRCDIYSYISSRKIDDWRYRNETDKIITTFYALVSRSGEPKANDDIKELYKVDVASLSKENVVEEHRKLFDDLKTWIANRLSAGTLKQ